MKRFIWGLIELIAVAVTLVAAVMVSRDAAGFWGLSTFADGAYAVLSTALAVGVWLALTGYTAYRTTFVREYLLERELAGALVWRRLCSGLGALLLAVGLVCLGIMVAKQLAANYPAPETGNGPGLPGWSLACLLSGLALLRMGSTITVRRLFRYFELNRIS